MYLLIKHESIIYDYTIKKMLNYVNCISKNDLTVNRQLFKM